MRPKIFHATEHDIDPSLLDSDALYVLEKLKREGFQAYLVGGSVRDLLTKQSPKDYDISTSAKPEEIRRLFRRNCLLIGKRFRLAHIRFGHKVIEVSTFRSGDNDSDLIIRDNTWGTEEEDVLRRDFTINGLFYDPTNHSIIDYVGGWDDIHQRILRTIGDPNIRFKQDPVRMIRLLKFRARFGFEIEEKTKQGLIEHKEDIVNSSPARILEEMFRMLESGSSAQFFNLMTSSGILKFLFPQLSDFLNEPEGEKTYELLGIADQINKNRNKKPLDRALLTSCLLFPMLVKKLEIEFLEKDKTPHLGDIIMATSTLIKEIVTSSFSHFPRKISQTMAGILTNQFRLTPLYPKRQSRQRLLKNSEFPLALQFLKVRAVANPKLMREYNSWNNTYRSFMKQQEHRASHHPPPQKRRRRKYDRPR